jgi:hypothetical protein
LSELDVRNITIGFLTATKKSRVKELEDKFTSTHEVVEFDFNDDEDHERGQLRVSKFGAF